MWFRVLIALDFYKPNKEINKYIAGDLSVIFSLSGPMAYKNMLHVFRLSVSQKKENYRWKTFACLLEPEKIGCSCWEFLLH